MRICSLLPGATEILFALGLGDRLVAVTLPLLMDKDPLGAAAPLSAEHLRFVEGYGALAARVVAHLKRRRDKGREKR